MKSEMPPILLALLAFLALLARFALALAVACIASLLLFVGFSWVVGCVVGGFLSLRTI